MAMKFLDLRGLQQVWTAILAKESALQTSIDNVKKSISFTADGYAKALEVATADNVGKIVMVSGDASSLTHDGVVYAAGPYVITGVNSISFLATSSGDVEGDELTALKGRVSTVEGSVATLNTAVEALQTKSEAFDVEYENTINGLNSAIDGKVAKEDGKSLVADSEITKLAGIEAGAQVNVIETVKVNGTALEVAEKAVNIVIPDAVVKGVEAADPIISLGDNGVLSSTLNYTREEYDGEDSLVLKGKDGAVIGAIPVADFVVDGMLKNVEHVGDNLVFTFNVDVAETGDNKKVISVDLSKYIDAYSAGNGIDITNNIISVVNPFTVADKTKLDETAVAVANIDLTPFAKTADVEATYVKLADHNPFTATDKANLEKVIQDVAAIDLTPFAKTADIESTYATQVYVDNTFVKTADLNPFTTEDKTALDAAVAKLADIEEGAQVNKIESVVFGDTNLVDADKKVDLTKIFASAIAEDTDVNLGLTVGVANEVFLKKVDVDALSESDIDGVLNPVQE